MVVLVMRMVVMVMRMMVNMKKMVVMVMKKVFTMMRMVAMVIETMISVFPANIYNCVFCLFFCGPPGSYWVSTDVYVLTLCMCIIDLPIVLISSSSE